MSTKQKAAPKAAKQETEKTPTVKVGQRVAFKEYGKDVPKEEQLFETGDILEITKLIEADNFEVKRVSDGKEGGAFLEEVDLEITAEEQAKAGAAPARIKRGQRPATGEAPEAEGKKGTKKAKAPKVPKIPKSQLDPELEIIPVEDYTEEVQKQVKTNASALKAAKALTDRIGEDFFALGGVLSFVRRNKAYKEIKDDKGVSLYSGQKGFDQYVLEELGLEYRRAMYYIDIYEKFLPLGIAAAQLHKIGWAKAKELARVVTKKNVAGWLKKAEELKQVDLFEEIKKVRVKAAETGHTNAPSGPSATMVKFNFRLFEDQGKVAEKAIETAKETLGPDADASAAFNHICNEFMALQGGEAGKVLPIDEAFKVLENRYSLNDVSKYAKKHYGK